MMGLFGILQLDRGEPLGFANALGLLQAWLQEAGGFAAIGLIVYLLYAYTVPTDKSQSEKLRVPVSNWMLGMGLLSLIAYGGWLALLILHKGAAPELPPPPPGMPVITPPPTWHREAQPLLMMVAGIFALCAICEPFVRDLFKVRLRRIWALAKLGFKEALRYHIHWALLALVFFPFVTRSVWMSNTKPVDEFRVLIVYSTYWFTMCLLLIALIISAFSLPNDIKNLTIHTVVTKPVERFEILLGRFLGYTGLMTLALGGMTAVSLLMINFATIDEAAKQESAKARVPIRGKLQFTSRKPGFEGVDVGKEFSYRKYITGHPISPERGIWSFVAIPNAMLKPAGDTVPVEFTLDVFKMTKGVENEGARVSFRIVTHNAPQMPPRADQRGEWQWGDKPGESRGSGEERKRAYENDLAALPKGTITAKPGSSAWAAVNQLAEKHGFYEIRDKQVFDYSVMGLEIPAGLFRNAAQGDPGYADKEQKQPLPRLFIYVKCESPGQMLGMAEPDLYLLETNQPFSLNFVKGMIGLWCQLCILIGLAIACSTYMSGVLSLLIAGGVFVLGFFTDHITDVALSRNVGGGPLQTISQLLQSQQPTAPFGESSGAKVVTLLDHVWAWCVRRFQNVVPDLESFSWTNFISEGFNINSEYLAINVLVMIGYLLPWAVLAYYLMKSREVAS